MYRKYIQAVEPLDDHILLIDFTSGSRLLLDMKPYLDSIRFRSLVRPEVWSSAETNGVFVRFGSVELSHDELMAMAEQGPRAFCRFGGNRGQLLPMISQARRPERAKTSRTSKQTILPARAEKEEP